MAITSPSTPIFSSFFCCKRAYGPCLLFLLMNASMLRNFVIESARWGLSIIVRVLAKFERQRVCVFFILLFLALPLVGSLERQQWLSILVYQTRCPLIPLSPLFCMSRKMGFP